MPHLHHEKTNRNYEIIEYDPQTKRMKLKGPLGPFEETYDKERLKNLGYRYVKDPEPVEADEEE
jgi:hypothetical protein